MRISGWVLGLLLLASAWAQGDEFEQANQLAEQRRYSEALAIYRKLYEREPNSPGLVWNLGISAQYCLDWPTALAAWRKMRELEPENWKVRGKLIQVYQGMGETAERDRERQELLALRAARPKVVNEPAFCRDQFDSPDGRVVVFENFDFSGERKVRYRFVVTDPTGRQKYVLSLGSYDATTQFARETGDIKADQRMFHLDYYGDKEHRTYAMVVGEPGYEETRQWVVDILNGVRKPQSSSKQG